VVAASAFSKTATVLVEAVKVFDQMPSSRHFVFLLHVVRSAKTVHSLARICTLC
jgi:hypothetical protein